MTDLPRCKHRYRIMSVDAENCWKNGYVSVTAKCDYYGCGDRIGGKLHAFAFLREAVAGRVEISNMAKGVIVDD